MPLWPAIARRGESPAVIKVSEQTQIQTAEQFLDALFGNLFDLVWSYLHPQLQKAFPPKRLQEGKARFLKWVGAYKERLGSESNGNIVSVKVAFAKVTDTLIVIMDSNGKITGVDFPATSDDLSAQPLPLRFRP
ncbi:hypothetical protein [Thermosynechococcus sp.]|uniref:hypothetical protein n=1 Tax=Thermosynechococcus sp. TaxID=2814275 RepID=UPI00391B5478